jgi:hypothetical protein
VYVSKASGDVTQYDGSGSWAKIAEIGRSSPPKKKWFMLG